MGWKAIDGALEVKTKFEPLSEFGHRIQGAILPIVALVDDEIIPLGTAFAVTMDGLLMTAKHLFDEIDTERMEFKRRDGNGYHKKLSLNALYIGGKNDDNLDYMGGLWPIDYVWFDVNYDIAFCWLKKGMIGDKQLLLSSVLKLSFQPPKIGENTLAFGYYENNAKYTNEIWDGKTVVDYSQKTAFTQGRVIEIFKEKRDGGFLKFPCFQIDSQFELGMSGAPVFNEKGSVCGIVCASTKMNDGQGYLSYASLLYPSLAIKIGVKIEESDTEKEHYFYEYIERNVISTDGKVEVSVDPENKQKLKIKIPKSE